MSLPAVTITKPAFSSSSSPNVTTGILAIVAASSTGTANVPSGFARSDLAVTQYGYGPLTNYGAYTLAVANAPFVAVKSNPTFPGSYTGLNTTGVSGTSTVTTAGAPFDYYNVVVSIVNDGNGGSGTMVGVTGIVYNASLDGGNVFLGNTALGTATSITLPNTGVQFNLSAGTLKTGDTWSVFTQRPLMNDSDVLTSLGALFNSRLPFEGVVVDSSCTSSSVGLVDTFLASQEAQGIFKFVLLNSRYKLQPEPTAETEAAYATALGTTFNTSTSFRICVGADGAHVPSLLNAWNLKMPTNLLLGARAMAIPVGRDPAYVADGPVTGAQITDSSGNPFDHDEGLFPDLDNLRFTTLRSFPAAGPQGVYITNANTIQANGGSYPYLQHIRIMNQACSIAWQILTTQLSLGVRKNPQPDPVTGAVYIWNADAVKIENLVNPALQGFLGTQVSAISFQLSRTDNLNVVPVVLTGTVQIQAQAYVKGYAITASFVKSITTTS